MCALTVVVKVRTLDANTFTNHCNPFSQAASVEKITYETQRMATVFCKRTARAGKARIPRRFLFEKKFFNFWISTIPFSVKFGPFVAMSMFVLDTLCSGLIHLPL